MAGVIMALDVATNTGVAFGDPAKGMPVLSSIRFGAQGDSLEASFAAAMEWMERALKEHNPRMVVFEAPLPPSFNRGTTNASTTRKLHGLVAVIGGLAHRLRFFNIREAVVADVRGHFLGVRRMRRKEAKAATIARCKALGVGVRNDDEADAFAIWSYAAGLHAAQPELMPCTRARKPKGPGQSTTCRAKI